MTTHASHQFERALISRVVTVKAGKKKLLMSVDVPQHERWQFIFMSTGGSSGNGELEFIYKSRIAQLKTHVTFGVNNGDIITGQGAVEIYLTASPLGSTEVSCYMSSQSYDIDVGSLVQHQVLASTVSWYYIGGNNGYMEFPFNRYQIITTNNINVAMADEALVSQYSVTGMTPLQAQEIRAMPLNYTLGIQPTIASQQLTIMYLRQD